MGRCARNEEWDRREYPREEYEEMPMHRYYHPIPFCPEERERERCCRRLEGLLSCQNQLLREILEELKGNT